MKDPREIAALLVAREDEEARLERIAKKAEVIGKLHQSITEAQGNNEMFTIIRMGDTHDHEHVAVETAKAALKEMGLQFTMKREEYSWGIRDLNTGYTVIFKVITPP